jgi:hypothetical protein
MVSTTSGTTSFTLDVDDIIDSALEPFGYEYVTAVDMQRARRDLNLLLIELQNKGIPLNKIETVSTSLLADTISYELDSSISDVLEATLKTVSSGVERGIERYSREKYHNKIVDKDMSGVPTVYMTDRNEDAVTVYVWQVPEEDSTYTLELLVFKRVEDITASFQKLDISYRYYPLIVSWLAYKFSLKKTNIEEPIKARLEREYLKILDDTFNETRERTDTNIKPGGICGS